MAATKGTSLPLSERWRPTHLDQVVGNPRARAELRAWGESWAVASQAPARRAAVLSGPAGVGKTTAAIALANDLGWTVVEMNASDARNESAIEQVAGRASISHTLGASAHPDRPARALILLDEADCLTGRLTETAAARPEPPPLREFLRTRYRTVEALNAAYGLKPGGKPAPFEVWEAIPKAPGNATWARLPAARLDIDDWRGSQRASDLSDRGGMAAIARLVRSTRQPLVLTVNDERVLSRYSPVFRSSVARIRFYPIRDAEIRSRLEAVARAEHLGLAPGCLDAIVRRARGDLRGALNDLDAISPLEPGPLQLSVLGSRDLGSDLLALAEESLTTPRYYRSVEVQDRLDAPPDDLLPWIEENIPHFAPDARHRAEAIEVLAVAERFLSRARRARVWSQWSYASELLTGGVGLALHDRPVPRTNGAAFPQFLGEMGRSRGARSTREAVVAKVGQRFHLSHEKTRETLLPFLESIFRPRLRPGSELLRTARGVARELELNAEEVALLTGSEPESAAVGAVLGGEVPTDKPSEPSATGTEEEPGPSPAVPRRRQRQLSEFEG